MIVLLKIRKFPVAVSPVFLARVGGCQGQLWMVGCVSRWPQGSLLGKDGRNSVPLQSSSLCSLGAHYFGKLQEKLGLTLPELKCLAR